MVVEIKGVRLVAGNELVDYWQRDMTVVTTSHGAFIAYGYMAPAWGAMIGNVIDVVTECCKADSVLQWIHFENVGDK